MVVDLPLTNTGTEGETELRYRRLQTLPEQIAEQVSHAIMRGDYGPGDPVKEQDLANLFQVSRGPIREALRILEKEGVVRIVPNRGARVTSLSIQEVQDIFEIRAALSQLAAEHLCSSQDEKLRQGFVEQARAIVEVADDPDALNDYVNRSYSLSTMLSTSSSNRRLADMMQSLARQTIRYSLLGLRRPERRRESAAIWQQVAQAIGDRDAAQASRLILQLINDSKNAAVAELEEDAARGS